MGLEGYFRPGGLQCEQRCGELKLPGISGSSQLAMCLFHEVQRGELVKKEGWPDEGCQISEVLIFCKKQLSP